MAQSSTRDCKDFGLTCGGKFTPGGVCNTWARHTDADRAAGPAAKSKNVKSAKSTANAVLDQTDNVLSDASLDVLTEAYRKRDERHLEHTLLREGMPLGDAKQWAPAVTSLHLHGTTAHALQRSHYDVVEATRPLALSEVTNRVENDSYDPEVEQLMQDLDRSSLADCVNDGIIPAYDVSVIRDLHDENPELGIEGAVYGYIHHQFAERQQLVSA